MEKEYDVTFRIKIGENTSIGDVVEHIFGKITENSDLTKTHICFANGNEFTVDLSIVEGVK